MVGPMFSLMAIVNAASAFGATPSNGPSEQQWQQAISRLPVLTPGCYHAAYPGLEWSPVECRGAPTWPLGPATKSPYTTSAAPMKVGDGNDYLTTVAGTISQATGTFPHVSPHIAEQGRVGGAGGLVPNTFTLQLNTEFFSTPTCAGSSDPVNCLGWQQFVYDTGYNVVYMQYWLLDYYATCPSGWYAFAGDCYVNSLASTYNGNALTAADLATTTLVGTASLGGNDEVSLSDGSGQAALVVNGDDVLQLAKGWTTTEFDVFGDGNGSEAYFGANTTLAAAASLESNSPSPPTCTAGGFTGETNNLNLAHTPTISYQGPATMVSVQTNAKPTQESSAVTSSSSAGAPRFARDS